MHNSRNRWNFWTWASQFDNEFVIFEDTIARDMQLDSHFVVRLLNSAPRTGATKRKPGRIPEEEIKIGYFRRHEIRFATQEEIVMARLVGKLPCSPTDVIGRNLG